MQNLDNKKHAVLRNTAKSRSGKFLRPLCRILERKENMKKWSMEIKVTFGILFVGLIMLSSVYLFLNNRSAENSIEKEVINAENSIEKEVTRTGNAYWPAHSFTSAVDEAVTIVYGSVGDKSDIKAHQLGEWLGEPYYEYYREVSIEVIDLLKGNIEDTTVTYLEFVEENGEPKHLLDGIELVERNDEYIFFLNQYGAPLSPSTMLPVENGTVLTQGGIVPTSEINALASDISVETYLGAIEAALEAALEN